QAGHASRLLAHAGSSGGGRPPTESCSLPRILQPDPPARGHDGPGRVDSHHLVKGIEAMGPEIRDPPARVVPEPPVSAEEARSVEGNEGGRPEIQVPIETRRRIDIRLPADPAGIDVLEIPDSNVADLAELPALDDLLHLPVMGRGAV